MGEGEKTVKGKGKKGEFDVFISFPLKLTLLIEFNSWPIVPSGLNKCRVGSIVLTSFRSVVYRS